MAINITVVKSPEGVVPAEASKAFDEQGGTLGRGGDNHWVLVDPERFLSSCHCQISCENGHYFLTDRSTNGTFVNGSAQPLGRNNKVAIKDGDVFDIGDYRFSISVWAVEPVAASPFDSPRASEDSQQGNNIFGDSDFFGSGRLSQDSMFSQDPVFSRDPLPQNSRSSDPFANSSVPSELYDPVPEETDPLAAMDRAGQNNSSDPFGASKLNENGSDIFSSNTYSDGADAMNQAANWPASTVDGSQIPEDWDDDLMTDSSAPVPRSLPLTDRPAVPEHNAKDSRVSERPAQDRSIAGRQAVKPKIPLEPQVEPSKPLHSPRPRPTPRRPSTETNGPSATNGPSITGGVAESQRRSTKPVPPRKAASAQRSMGAAVADTTVIDAIGLGGFELSDERIQEINEIVGELVRETVIGMMQSLRSRATIKNEFRMNVTTIQPIENNPLKFSANIDDALENMFIKQSNAYKKPVEAVREGFQAVAEHQVALLAGIRSAFKSMIEGFNPESLEKQFERQSKGSMVPALGKGKYWNAYKDHYKNLADNMESSFQYMFGDEFVQAYEDQLIKLAKSRIKR